jgi:rhamnosyltransferase
MLTHKPEISSRVCITIPIKKPDSRLDDCINAISSQDVNYDLCVLLISSGHEQDQISRLFNTYSHRIRLTLRTISPDEYQHGRTRNLAATFVDAVYYVFLTQDAVPKGDSWLKELIAPLELDASVAGSFSRHVAHQEHSIFCKSELDLFFLQLNRFPIVNKEMLSQASSQKESDLMTFFSNNSSCIRGSLFKHDLHFPEVEFAEDQAWSIKAITNGYKKAFSYRSIVHHSHDLNIYETFGRGLDEAKSFRVNHNRRIMKANPLYILRGSLALSCQDLRHLKALRPFSLVKDSMAVINQVAKRISQNLGMYVGSSEVLSKLFSSSSRDFAFKNRR